MGWFVVECVEFVYQGCGGWEHVNGDGGEIMDFYENGLSCAEFVWE